MPSKRDKVKCGACGAFEARCKDCGEVYDHGSRGLCSHLLVHQGTGELECVGCGRPVKTDGSAVATFDGEREYPYLPR